MPGGPGTTAVCAAGIVAPDGSIAEPVRTPEFSASFGGNYEIPLGEVSLVPSLNASWHSDQEIQTSNYTIYEGASSGTNGTFPANPYGGKVVTGSFDDAVWFVNASLALRDIDEAWQVTAGCTNCFDAVSSTGVLAYTYFTPPRMWTVRARYRF